jgi:hypothetical protein
VISTWGCQALAELVRVNLTAALRDADAALQPFLRPAPPLPPPASEQPTPGRVDLRHAALTGVLSFALNTLLGPQLNGLAEVREPRSTGAGGDNGPIANM